jgi:hypothetical protein
MGGGRGWGQLYKERLPDRFGRFSVSVFTVHTYIHTSVHTYIRIYSERASERERIGVRVRVRVRELKRERRDMQIEIDR